METKKFITKKARSLANQFHKEEHLIINKKIEETHRLDDWYYLMAGGIFTHLEEKIQAVEMCLRMTNKELRKMVFMVKEIAKQQKYLWQTLEENNGYSENKLYKEVRNG